MMLALRLGRTLDELGRSMTADEFALWIALYRDNQWGEQSAYERSGIVASTVANYAGMMRAKDSEPARPSDFMPYPPKQAEAVEVDPVDYFSALGARSQG